jgi:dihydrofolate synthase / folylpolyglutamate synthase
MTALATALAGVYARAPLGIHLGLTAMRAACARAGHPEARFDAVHIAGTNGKGSVAAMVESMARAHGLRTGLYTSPHLCRFAERIRIDGEPLDDETLARALAEALANGPELSFFEVATLASFLAFRDAKVDLAVVEVGLGGRLDATNVLPMPRVAAITRIALDHTDLLGATIAEIAREKAGIAKAGLEVVIGAGCDDVYRVLDGAIRERSGTSTFAEHVAIAQDIVQRTPIALAGVHQMANARVAAVIGARLAFSRESVERGLATASWPGRLETIARNGMTYLLDAAHNADGIDALAAYLETRAWRSATPPRVALVFGALADKPWHAMIARLAPLASRHHFVAPAGRAPADPKALATMYAGKAHDDARSALAAAAEDNPDLVVVAGSIYLVGHARAELLDLPRDPVVAL